MINKKNVWLTFILFCIFLMTGYFTTSTYAQPLQRYEFESVHMGTTFQLIFYATGDSVAQQASRKVFHKVEQLNTIMSDYIEDSEINRISDKSGNEKWIKVSQPLYRVLKKAQQVSRQTDGAFDVTVGPYVQLWRPLSGKNNPQLPSPDTLNQLSKEVDYCHLKVDKKRKAVQLSHPNMRLDLGGIAKGFAADEALQVLQGHDIRSALIDAGGDIVLGNAPPEQKGWGVGIQRHNKNGETSILRLTIANAAVATSGDLFQSITIGGQQYSHIVDPRTGLGLTNQSTVTVIAPNGITADSYASAVSVMGPDDGIGLLNRKPALEGQVEFKTEEGIKSKQSSNFDIYFKAN